MVSHRAQAVRSLNMQQARQSLEVSKALPSSASVSALLQVPYFAQTHDRDISKVQTESGLMMLEKLQNVMTVTDSLCQFWQPKEGDRGKDIRIEAAHPGNGRSP